MKSLLFILLIGIASIQCLSQTTANMIKYWHYRDRLKKYFVVPGEKHGESQIICVRNRIAIDEGYDINVSGKKNADYGQHGN